MAKRILFACLCVVLASLTLTLGAVQAQDSPPKATPLIIDTDMASDDWMAILSILKNPDFDVKAITVTGAAFADCDAGVAAALGLVALANYGDVPVSCWKDEPLRGGAVRVPLEWRTNMAAVEALGLPAGGKPAEQNAVELFTATAEASETPITVLSLGGFTNIAAAFEANPDLVKHIERIYAMGGAVDVEGSHVSDDNTTAEWNIYADPTAARLVFESGVPITLVGLDATNLVPITMDFFKRLGETKATPEAEFVYKVLEGRQESIQGGYDYFWDPLAAGVLADPSLVTLTDRNLIVVDADGPELGRTKPLGEGEGNVVQVASATNAAGFEQEFLDRLNGQ